MIVRDHLFVFFGYSAPDKYAENIEYLNLLSEEPEKGSFTELKLEGYTDYHAEPMIFPATLCETEMEIEGSNETVLYFFGGENRP